MTVYRYINNTSTDIVAGSDTVPAYGQLVLTSRAAGLEPYVDYRLTLLIDGVQDVDRGTGDMKLLFVLRDANMAITTDQAFVRVTNMTNYIVTTVVARRKTGGASVACAGGIYDTASKAGVLVLPNTTDFVSLSSTVPVVVTGSGVNKTLPTTGNLFLSLTTGSTAACTADIFVYGVVVD